MAGGQGFKGNTGTGEGVYFSVVMDAEDAIVTAEQLDGKIDNLTVSMKELGDSSNVTTGEFIDMSQAQEKSVEKTQHAIDANDMYILKLSLVVSGLNQLTGSLYKTIGGLEAAGAISEDHARHWQKNARMIEMVTGPLELVISLEILYSAVTKKSLIAKAMNTQAYLTLAAAVSTATTAMIAFAIANPFTALVIVAFALAAVIVFLANKFGVLGAQFEWINEKADAVVQSLTGVGDGVRDLLTIDISGSRLWGGILGGD